MQTIHARLDKILPKITDKRFRENKGLGNEIGFYIFDYDPQDELLVREHIAFLKQKINNEHSEIQIREFDLFEIIIEILESKGYLDKVFAMELEKGSEAIIEPIQNSLRLNNDKNDLVVDYIRRRIHDNGIIILTGVGKAWPLIRSHKVLNRLHSVVEKIPLIIFFPGLFTGLEMRLFDEFSDQNYYRAFTLVER